MKISLPGKPWAVAVDLPGFAEQINETKPGGRRYWYWTNKETGVGFSLFLEKVGQQADIEECRRHLSAKAKDAKDQKMKGVKLSESGQWALLEYTVKIQGTEIRQRNLFACMAKDDVYVDVHFSKVLLESGEEKLFTAILETLRFEDGAEVASESQTQAPTLASVAAEEIYETGQALYEKGDLAGAMKEFREALRVDPNHVNAHSALGNALDDSGDVEGALAEYHTALRLNPDSPEAHMNLGVLLVNKKSDPEGAIAEYREAIRLSPKWPHAHWNFGLALKQKGDLPGALDEFRTAKHFAPDNQIFSKAYVKALVAHHQQGIPLKPGDGRDHLALALVLSGSQQAQHHEQAIGYFEAYFRYVPQTAEKANEISAAHFTLGQLHEKLGREKDALGQYEEALKTQPPPDPMIWNNAAWLYATAKDTQLRNPQRAVEYAKKAVEGVRGQDAEKEAAALDTLAEAHYVGGEFKEAIEAEKKAVALLKSDHPQYKHCQEQLKKFEQAKRKKR